MKIDVIITPEEKERFKQAGEKLGIKRLATYLRVVGLEKAREVENARD